MASKDPNYIQSDEIISDLLSPTISSNSIQSTPVCRLYKTNKARKRKFQGNRHTSEIVLKNNLEREDCLDEEKFVHVKPISNKNVDTVAGRKLVYREGEKQESICLEVCEDSDDYDVTPKDVYAVQGNYVIDLNSFSSILREVAMCRACEVGSLELFDSGKKESCSTFLILRCNSCHYSKSFWSVSGTFGKSSVSVSSSKIRMRNDMVYSSILGGRLVGIGLDKLSLYHAALNIPSPPSRYIFSSAQRNILVGAEQVARESMDRARMELESIYKLVSLNNRVHCVASYDGAYQLRSGKSGGGFSRYCFSSAISVNSGKVLSYDVACNSCPSCNEFELKLNKKQISESDYRVWVENHKSICPAQYSEFASVQLESALAPVIVRQAYDRGIIFSGLVCDGDNKTIEALKDARVYQQLGQNFEISRLECLSHVAKRMKINLCNRQEAVLKEARNDKKAEVRYLMKEKQMNKQEVNKKIGKKYVGTLKADSKVREGWKGESTKKSVAIHHLSVAMCAQIASYYRLAVQRNKNDIPSIIRAINAIPLHLGANDDNAATNHRYCPYSKDSWCHYQAAIFNSRTPPNHPNYLSQTAVDLIFSTFDDFKYNKEEFIDKISGGMTSNHNEAIHSILYQMVRKTEAVGMDTMKLGAALAVIRYNDGFAGVKNVFEMLGVNVGVHMSARFVQLDNIRILRSEGYVAAQQRRFAKRQRRGHKVRKQVREHGEGYSSGKFTVAQPDLVRPTEEETAIDSSPASDCCAVCGFSEESGMIGIDVAGLPVSSDEILWVECSKCEQWYHQLCVDVESEELSEEFDWVCGKC